MEGRLLWESPLGAARPEGAMAVKPFPPEPRTLAFRLGFAQRPLPEQPTLRREHQP